MPYGLDWRENGRYDVYISISLFQTIRIIAPVYGGAFSLFLIINLSIYVFLSFIDTRIVWHVYHSLLPQTGMKLRAALQREDGSLPGFLRVCDGVLSPKGRGRASFAGMVLEKLNGRSPLSSRTKYTPLYLTNSLTDMLIVVVSDAVSFFFFCFALIVIAPGKCNQLSSCCLNSVWMMTPLFTV